MATGTKKVKKGRSEAIYVSNPETVATFLIWNTSEVTLGLVAAGTAKLDLLRSESIVLSSTRIDVTNSSGGDGEVEFELLGGPVMP